MKLVNRVVQFFSLSASVQFLSLILFVLLSSFSANAQEKIGSLEVVEILLRPTYYSEEKNGGEFSFQDSSFSVQWSKGDQLSAFFQVGSVLERGTSQIYLETEPADGLGFIEAYGTYSGVYGSVRGGLMPLGYAEEGLRGRTEQIFPEGLLFSERLVALSDYGFSYRTEHNDFYSELVVHNGEVDVTPNDGNPWVTAHWGWQSERLKVLISGQAGASKATATSTAGSQTLGGWDRSQNADWRFVTLSSLWTPRKSEVFFHYTAGEAEQNGSEKTFALWQLDWIRYVRPGWGFGLRHDQFDVNSKISNDLVSEESAMLFTKSADSTSVLSLVFTKRLEEDKQVDNDRFWLQWRLTPFAK